MNSNEIIENGKKDLKQLLKKVFEDFEYTKQQNVSHIDYKMSIYNSPNWLDKPISNFDYSDLLGCMLDIEEDFEDIKHWMDVSLDKINEFKKIYIEEHEEEEEYEETEDIT